MRGRKPLPAAIKELKSDRRKQATSVRAAAASAAEQAQELAAAPPLQREDVVVPDFLTSDRSREVFRRVIDDHVQNRIARGPDLTAYARWAYYVDKWIELKEEVDVAGKVTYETKGKYSRMKRQHPAFIALMEIEPHLVRLEDRLAINPASRQSYLRGLMGLSGGLPDDVGPRGDKKAGAPAAPQKQGPIGALARSATPKEKMN